MTKRIIERFDFYKLESNNTPNSFILFDKVANTYCLEVSMVTLYDIIKDRDISLIASLNSGVELTMDYVNSTGIKKVHEILIENQKQIFKKFKDIILVNKVNVFGVNYSPATDKIILKDGLKFFNINTFKSQRAIVKDKKLEYPHLEFFMKNILQDGYEKFLHFMAWKIQKPTEHINCHWVIYDEGGTGKTEILAYYVLKKMMSISVISQEDLQNTFNEFLAQTQLVICEEIEGYGDEKKIKNLTGARQVMINAKYERTYTMTNYTNFLVYTNELKSLRINKNDRRFNVVGGGKRILPKSQKDTWDKCLFESSQVKDLFFKGFHKNLEKELDHLYTYLKNLVIDEELLRIPLDTSLKKELIEINYSSEEQFLHIIAQEGIFNVIEDYTKFSAQTFLNNSVFEKDKEKHIKNSAFYKIYYDFCSAVGMKALSHIAFSKRIKTHEKLLSQVIQSEGFVKYEGKNIRTYLLVSEEEPESEELDLEMEI